MVEALRRELQWCEGKPGAQQEQTAAVLRVKREQEAAIEGRRRSCRGSAELTERRGKVREAE